MIIDVDNGEVAPARERGLKYAVGDQPIRIVESLPRGSVD